MISDDLIASGRIFIFTRVTSGKMKFTRQCRSESFFLVCISIWWAEATQRVWNQFNRMKMMVQFQLTEASIVTQCNFLSLAFMQVHILFPDQQTSSLLSKFFFSNSYLIKFMWLMGKKWPGKKTTKKQSRMYSAIDFIWWEPNENNDWNWSCWLKK